MVTLLLLLSACNPSTVPETAVRYTVTVTGTGPDTCNPGNTEGYQEAFEYAVDFTGSRADVYVDGVVFATGTINGCDLTYRTVVFGEDIESGSVKWQLTGTASIEPGDDSCSLGEGVDWSGTEVFEIVDADVDAEPGVMEIGCTYPMSTEGVYVPSEG